MLKMFRIRLFRSFSSSPQIDPRFDLLKGTAVPPEQLIYKQGKKGKVDRIKTSFEERFQDMKDMFGEEYKTPSEKYDLHFPRVEATGEKDFDMRYNEKRKFWKGTVQIWIISLFLLGGASFVVLKFRWDVKSQQELIEEKKKEQLFLSNNKYGISEKLREERLAKITQLKNEYKQKYGINLDDD